MNLWTLVRGKKMAAKRRRKSKRKAAKKKKEQEKSKKFVITLVGVGVLVLIAFVALRYFAGGGAMV